MTSEVCIVDLEGVAAEFTGYYGATDGSLIIRFDFAPNDRIGVWEIQANELASGKSSSGYVRLAVRIQLETLKIAKIAIQQTMNKGGAQ